MAQGRNDAKDILEPLCHGVLAFRVREVQNSETNRLI